MTVLVAYASAYGSTKGIARAIADRLSDAGLQVDLRSMDDVGSTDSYEAFVLGSAVHNGAWLPPAASFMVEHAGKVAGRPVWLFSVCSIGDTSSFFGPRLSGLARRRRVEGKDLVEYRRALGPRGHRYFAGVIERNHWGRIGRLVLRLFGGGYGDHRDWADVAAWASGIAGELTVRGASSPSSAG
jgi:menaquinone-dependent protoporphyrinogen oxidase